MPILGCLCSSISIRAPRMGSNVNPSTPVVTMGIFQSTPPAWEATIQLFRYQPGLYISIHAPAWGATSRPISSPLIYSYFNPRPRMGSDIFFVSIGMVQGTFQSTPPHGERQGLTSLIPLQRHILKAHRKQAVKFQSTLPAWGATPVRFPALRQFPYFNPRSSHGERRIRRWNRDLFQGFQSTLPAWGATCYVLEPGKESLDFNPRPPHGERLDKIELYANASGLQSTPPAWGATAAVFAFSSAEDAFQSTPPAWGATWFLPPPQGQHSHFNPRPPHGERPHTSFRHKNR